MDPKPDPSFPVTAIIADDEYLAAVSLESAVQNLGIEVLARAGDGEELIRLAGELRPDIVLADIRMPNRDGTEAAGLVWDELGIPVLLVSAYSDEEYLARAQDGQAFGYVVKPVDAASLRVAIGIAWARALESRDLSDRVGRLERTLEVRKLVEQAKWRLVEERGIPEPEAHAALQRVARSTRRPLGDVASGFLSTGTLDGQPPPGPPDDAPGRRSAKNA